MIESFTSIVGIDIGGTKCSVVKATRDGAIQTRRVFVTGDFVSTIEKLRTCVEEIDPGTTPVFGISCGGPLDSERGLIQSPPNLPGWDNVPIVEFFTRHFGGKAFLMNDANAGAIAEWKFGAAKGYKNIVFLTYGTGMGAGLILNGLLYEGTSGMAGEVGHIRLASDGPVGYGKAGSFEGFCSGGGIAQLGREKVRRCDGKVSFNKAGIDTITAKDVAEAAKAGDTMAKEIIEESARYAGNALATIIDILNPQIIVLGSFFVRCQELLEPIITEVVRREALDRSVNCCKIVPSGLGEQIGDYAAISIALYNIENSF
ncbi:MAG TPA: ROK family protein [Methylococcales bacterium]